MNTVTWLPAQTGDGEFLLGYSDKGLCSVTFPEMVSDESRQFGAAADEKVRAWHEVAVCALKEALAGKTPTALPPLDLSRGTSFQQNVWRALMGISPGRTLSYGQIAQVLGKPGASRAVGAACGANPLPVLVPCHRVLAANQKLGGFSGGLHWKQRLLQREGSIMLR